MIVAEKSSFWYSLRLRLIGWGAAVALLSLPAIAMAAGANGVLWTASDFVLFAIMLGLLGGGIELAVSRHRARNYRVGAAIMALASFLTVWVNLAVGMVGDGPNAYNLTFMGIVPAVALGAFVTRGSAHALAFIALGAAAIQLVTALAGLGIDPAGGTFSLMFILPWLVAAALLRSAPEEAAANRPTDTASSGRRGSAG